MIFYFSLNVYRTLRGTDNDEPLVSKTLVGLNDGHQTRINVRTGLGAANDLTLVSLSAESTSEVASDKAVGGDHYPMVTTIDFGNLQKRRNTVMLLLKVIWNSFTHISAK